MTKEQAPIRRRIALAGLSLGILLLVGCRATAQPKPPVQHVTRQEAQQPHEVVESQSKAVFSLPAPSVVTEIDAEDSLLFAQGSSSLGAMEKKKLRHHASRLKEDRDLFVTLIGHGNDNGSASFNLAVADARVTSVGAVLRKLGVNAWQIKKRVVGGEKLPSTCRSVECRRKMRRVELLFSKSR